MIVNSGYVYVVRVCDAYKIGVSVLPEQRVSLIRTDNFEPMEIIGFWQFKDPYGVEQAIHEFLESYRIRGEWFRLDESMYYDILEVLDELVAEKV